jgi:hypothetical protein
VSEISDLGRNLFGKNIKASTLDERIKRVFIYYLVYGEIHDVRNIKSVFHLFYHVTQAKIEAGERMVRNHKTN